MGGGAQALLGRKVAALSHLQVTPYAAKRGADRV
jgi:hypothetical protein